MIFSKDKWSNGDEIRAFVKVNTAVSFAMMETPLNNAFNLFLKPLLGPSLSAQLVEIYNNDAPKDTEKELLRIAQRANANLALWYEFDAISVRITDAGFQRQESENGTFKPAYKYQEDNLRQSYKNKDSMPWTKCWTSCICTYPISRNSQIRILTRANNLLLSAQQPM